MIEEEIIDKDETSEEDVELVQPYQGLSIVVRRALKSSCEVEENWVRTNVFHTNCTFKGRFCMVIIDSFSFENVVSMKMVQMLILKTVSHSHPYKFCWLQSGNENKVNKRRLVSFSIGHYKDTIWCDVVPIDAYHMLLGRPCMVV